ncbi:hypothetical protein [Pedobacter antarcticus]|uniref:hypothetical protein n=1 Tax=Pedobacter antarcticus TaxID=34086 RepID=UPI000B2885EA|nr:hypothetical protein [Pedobacter antarcticus]
MNYLYKISLLCCVLTITSCKKSFLDLSDPTKKTADRFYKNEQEFQQAVNGAYSSLQDHVNSQYVFAEMPSDNTTIQLNPSDRGQTDRAEAFEFWNLTATNVNISELYSQSYNALYNINYALLKLNDVPGISEKKKNSIRVSFSLSGRIIILILYAISGLWF